MSLLRFSDQLMPQLGASEAAARVVGANVASSGTASRQASRQLASRPRWVELMVSLLRRRSCEDECQFRRLIPPCKPLNEEAKRPGNGINGSPPALPVDATACVSRSHTGSSRSVDVW